MKFLCPPLQGLQAWMRISAYFHLFYQTRLKNNKTNKTKPSDATADISEFWKKLLSGELNLLPLLPKIVNFLIKKILTLPKIIKTILHSNPSYKNAIIKPRANSTRMTCNPCFQNLLPLSRKKKSLFREAALRETSNFLSLLP